jgi:hypothetical protein
MGSVTASHSLVTRRNLQIRKDRKIRTDCDIGSSVLVAFWSQAVNTKLMRFLPAIGCLLLVLCFPKPTRAQSLCDEAEKVAEAAAEQRDNLDQISVLQGIVAVQEARRCIVGCTEQQQEDAVSPEERELYKRVIAFAYSRQGRELSIEDLKSDVHAQCIADYGGR